MKTITVVLVLGLLACAQGSRRGGLCSLDPKDNKEFACVSADGKVTITPGYSAEKIYLLMKDRENNAWSQMSHAMDLQQSAAMAHEVAVNAKNEYGKSPRVVEIASANVTKTDDNGNTVISLSTANRKKTFSLWLNPDGSVRTITPY